MLNTKLGIAANTALCLCVACWRFYFPKVIPAFICSSHLATHCFLLDVLVSLWDCPTLGAEVSLPFLLSVLCLSLLWTLVPLPSCLLKYWWHLIEQSKMHSSLICFCGFTCIRWVTSYLCPAQEWTKMKNVPLFIHSVNIYWLPTTYCQKHSSWLQEPAAECGKTAFIIYWFLIVITLQRTNVGFYEYG